jgi:hypothetical protein
MGGQGGLPPQGKNTPKEKGHARYARQNPKTRSGRPLPLQTTRTTPSGFPWSIRFSRIAEPGCSRIRRDSLRASLTRETLGRKGHCLSFPRPGAVPAPGLRSESLPVGRGGKPTLCQASPVRAPLSHLTAFHRWEGLTALRNAKTLSGTNWIDYLAGPDRPRTTT